MAKHKDCNYTKCKKHIAFYRQHYKSAVPKASRKTTSQFGQKPTRHKLPISHA
eukprot:c31036_g1_i1 orf=333-491(+)